MTYEIGGMFIFNQPEEIFSDYKIEKIESSNFVRVKTISRRVGNKEDYMILWFRIEDLSEEHYTYIPPYTEPLPIDWV